MESAPVLKRKVTVKLSQSNVSPPRLNGNGNISRPPSPLKSHQTPPAAVIRPKAKVNSSATPIRKTASGNSSNSKQPIASIKRERSPVRPSASSTPRATSPFKSPPQPPCRDISSSTFRSGTYSAVRAVRPQTAQSAIETPESRRRSLSGAKSDAGPLNRDRTRHGSISLHYASSFSSLSHSQPPTRSGSPVAKQSPIPLETEILPLAPVTKVKAKISGLAKPSTDTLSPSPPHSVRSTPFRARAPSVGSPTLTSSAPLSPNPDHIFYPITTATAAANPHRYAPPRPPPVSRNHFYPFRTQPDERIHDPEKITAKVDPTLIPLPPQSPPTSALSISSRSSVSRSSATHLTESTNSPTSTSFRLNGSHVQANQDSALNSTFDEDLVRYHGLRLHTPIGDSERLVDFEDRKEHKDRAEAKSNRKIADLEITNRSLLAINASLETTKHRQAKEIRELRRKLRESRLILPPRAYRAVKSSLDHDDTTDDDDDGDEQAEDEDDVMYQRIKVLIEGLLESGKRALETKPSDFLESGKGTAKVLTAEEVKSWRDSTGDGSDHENGQNPSNVGDPMRQRTISPSRIAIPDSDEYNSEEEVESMTIPRDFTPPSHSPTPPILVTESP